MRFRNRRYLVSAALVGTLGYLFAGPGTSCASYIGESALVAANMCFIFDCQDGILGGTIDPCSGAGSGALTGEGQGATPQLFTDCPRTGGP